MPHIKINSGGFWVDGIQVDVHADDLKVDFSTVPPTVRCTFDVDNIDVDLPDAALDARNPGVERMIRLLEHIDANTRALGNEVGEAIHVATRRGRRGGPSVV